MMAWINPEEYAAGYESALAELRAHYESLKMKDAGYVDYVLSAEVVYEDMLDAEVLDV
jgi:hypothetical protein